VRITPWVAGFIVSTAACAQAISHQEPVAKLSTPRSQIVEGARTIEVVDLSPRFLDFYQAAANADPDMRWKLWQEKYDFAAVPPTPEGTKIARELLDAAWSRYPQVVSLIRAGAHSLEPRPELVLREVADLLGLNQPYDMQVLVYVGAFDDNAFTARQNGKPIVAVPIEMNRSTREIVFRHEMTHAVHMATAGLSGGWERSIAETVFQEGLAMRATQALVPGRQDRDYVEHKAGWYDAAMARSTTVLAGILPALEKSDSKTVFRFTMGQGTTGTEREAYVAGWLVIGELLRQGKTFPELARIPSNQMPAVIRAAVTRLRESSRAH
jgi:hypothetical protein